DPQVLIVLSDALEDAGCNDSRLLELLRDQEFREQLASWHKLYRENFNTNIDISTLSFPERSELQKNPEQGNYNQLLLVEKNLTLTQIAKVYQQLNIDLQIYDFRQGQERYRPMHELTEADFQELFERHNRITHDPQTNEEIKEDQRRSYTLF